MELGQLFSPHIARPRQTPSSHGRFVSSTAADTTLRPLRSPTASHASHGASGAINASTNVHSPPAATAEEVASTTTELHRDIEDGSRSDRRRAEPITVLTRYGVEQTDWHPTRDFPSWPGRSCPPTKRAEDTTAVDLRLLTSLAQSRGGVQIPC